jgi:hypothetical protein
MIQIQFTAQFEERGVIIISINSFAGMQIIIIENMGFRNNSQI